MVISPEQKSILIEYLPNAEALITADDTRELLLALDDVLTDKGFDKNEDLNEVGLVLQRLYDQIYLQNKAT